MENPPDVQAAGSGDHWPRQNKPLYTGKAASVLRPLCFCLLVRLKSPPHWPNSKTEDYHKQPSVFSAAYSSCSHHPPPLKHPLHNSSPVPHLPGPSEITKPPPLHHQVLLHISMMCPALHPVPAPFTRCSPHQPQATSDSFTATKLLLGVKSAEASYKASFVISTHFLSLLSVAQQHASLSVTAGFCLSSNRCERVAKITADIHDRGLITACISVQIIDTQVWETEHPHSTQLSWPNYLLQKTNTRDTEERGHFSELMSHTRVYPGAGFLRSILILISHIILN